MTLIPCDCDCIYQKEGYCNLEKPSLVTNNNTEKGCAYYIAAKRKSMARKRVKRIPDVADADQFNRIFYTATDHFYIMIW